MPSIQRYEGETDFAKIFDQFSETKGIYGFEDSQVKNIYNRIAS
jgi:hypothetical protein